MQVSCHLVKLVLRNNALTTLRGIENLKSLEGLDVSYNIISNFSELEFLWSLSLLKELWLEGNPVCCARWYRAHVFSYIALPDDVSFSFLYSCFGDPGILSACVLLFLMLLLLCGYSAEARWQTYRN